MSADSSPLQSRLSRALASKAMKQPGRTPARSAGPKFGDKSPGPAGPCYARVERRSNDRRRSVLRCAFHVRVPTDGVRRMLRLRTTLLNIRTNRLPSTRISTDIHPGLDTGDVERGSNDSASRTARRGSSGGR